MGRTHATSGAVAFLVLVPAAGAAGFDVSGLAVATGAVAAAGAAMLPDLDHPQASVSQALGPLTRLMARGVSVVSGGHRCGTHSLLGVAVVAGVGVVVYRAGGIWLGLWLAFLAAITLAALRVRLSRVTVVHTVACLIVGAALASLSVWGAVPLRLVPWAVAVGAAVHVAGDCLTREGCPLLWPVSSRRVAVLQLRTEGPVERWVIGPGLAVVAVVSIWQLADWDATAALLRRGVGELAAKIN